MCRSLPTSFFVLVLCCCYCSIADAATPAVVTLQLYNDSACSTPYPTSAYNIASISSPDVGFPAACLNVSSSPSSPWAQILVYCVASGGGFAIVQANYWTNVTGCDINVESYSLTFTSTFPTMGVCEVAQLTTYLGRNFTVISNVAAKFTCSFTSDATSFFPGLSTAISILIVALIMLSI